MRRIGWVVFLLSAFPGCDSEAGRIPTPFPGNGGSTGGSAGEGDGSATFTGGSNSASAGSSDTSPVPPDPSGTVTGLTSVGSSESSGGSSTGVADESGSDGSESSETGEQVETQPCSFLAFDAPVASPWQTLGDDVSIEIGDGQLRFDIPASVGFGILQYDTPFAFDDAFLRTRVTEFDAASGGTLVGINFDTGASTESVSLQIQGGMLEAIHGVPDQPLDVVQAPLEGYPVDLQLRAEMGSLVFEVSYDGVTWNAIRTLPRPAFLDAAHLNLVAGNWMAVEGARTATVAELETCEL